MTTVHFVVPDSIDDPARPSGGNIYDREVSAALGELGWTVRRHGVWGSPRDVLRSVPDGELVVVDGLIGGRDPDALRESAARLRLVLLLHMPAGLDGAVEEGTAVSAEAAALGAASAVVTTSCWTRDVLVARHGALAEDVRVVAPGVQAARRARGTADGGQLLYVGAVAPHKGLDVLVRALARLTDLPWECVCVGSLDRDREYVSDVQRLLARHGLVPRVRLVGAIDRDVLAKYYAAADVVAVPSRAEGYGMVVGEALAAGLPVLAADVGGIPEALGTTSSHDRPGLLLRAGDVQVWAVALRVWLTDAPMRKRLRELAAQRRETLPAWADTAAVLSGVLSDVVAQ